MKKNSTFEFDSFGPWILLINEDHAVPPLFQPLEKKLTGSLMAFKIPRDIERREANPAMNLYDAVMGILEDKILIFKRVLRDGRDGVQEIEIPLSEISGLRNNTYLLSGILTIYTAGKSIEIPYNTVSDEIIQEALGLIRKLMPPMADNSSPFLSLAALPYSRKTMELEFINICNRVQKEDPQMQLISYQPSIEYKVPRQFRSSLLMRLGLKEKVQSSYVIFHDKRELSIVQRTFFPDGPNTDAYAHLQCYLPLASLSAKYCEEKKMPLPRLILETDMMNEEFYFDPGNEGIRNILESIPAS